MSGLKVVMLENQGVEISYKKKVIALMSDLVYSDFTALLPQIKSLLKENRHITDLHREKEISEAQIKSGSGTLVINFSPKIDHVQVMEDHGATGQTLYEGTLDNLELLVNNLDDLKTGEVVDIEPMEIVEAEQPPIE
jgi:hypothetical protein